MPGAKRGPHTIKAALLVFAAVSIVLGALLLDTGQTQRGARSLTPVDAADSHTTNTPSQTLPAGPNFNFQEVQEGGRPQQAGTEREEDLQNAAPTNAVPDTEVTMKQTRLTHQEAERLAREACLGHANIPEDAPVQINESADEITVTFATVPEPNLNQGDFHAQVTLDAFTGQVVFFMGSQ